MKYGVIGEHLTHSFSKEIHSYIGEYEYEIKEIEPQALEEFMKKREFLGINVTIPYKERVIPMVDFVDPQAQKIGSVNTVVNKGGKLYGYNTDYAGMRALIQKMGLAIKDKKVLIVGTGGTSKTATCVTADMGAKEIIYVSHSGAAGAFTYEEVYASHADTEVIINTSPVGMYPRNDDIPLNLDAFPKLEGVLDAIYNPIRTNLVIKAQALGKIAQGGLYMLGAQAVYASQHFFGGSVCNSTLDRVYKSVLSMKDNIVLTGMPSSGKTTVGKLLAQLSGKAFVDTDAEIEKRVGKTIPQYFQEMGEVQFREIEAQVIEDVSKRTGLVIATGGGAVLNADNVRRLKQNGRIYFIDRDLEGLISTSDRPLSSNRQDLEKRYKERYGIYLSSADVKTDGNPEAKEVARHIYEEYNK